MRVLEVRKEWMEKGRRRAATEDIEAPIFIVFRVVFLQWNGEISKMVEELGKGLKWKRQQWREEKVMDRGFSFTNGGRKSNVDLT